MSSTRFDAIMREIRQDAETEAGRAFRGEPRIEWLGIAVDEYGGPAVDLRWNGREVRVSRGTPDQLLRRTDKDFTNQIEGWWLDTGERAIWTSTDAVEYSVDEWQVDSAYGLSDLLDWAMQVGFSAASRSLDPSRFQQEIEAEMHR